MGVWSITIWAIDKSVAANFVFCVLLVTVLASVASCIINILLQWAADASTMWAIDKSVAINLLYLHLLM